MKSTTLSTDRCNHGAHPRGEKLNSSDLSRYPEQMMQGLAAAILCRAGPVLEALRPGGTLPQANPTTPPRRQREPSPSTSGNNKRQSRRLKAGQQALAGLTLGSLPVSASDNPEVRTPTQRTGETDELRGGTLFPEPWAHHGMDRPTILPLTHDPNLSDQAMYLQMAFKQRPLRDGGGALIGTVGPMDPATVQSSRDGGQDLCPHFAVGGQAGGVALVGGGVTSLPGGFWRRGQADQPSSWKSCAPDSFRDLERGEEWWVNKVGTYGMASAQSYWGRLAALLLRVLYALFPVDDFLWLLPN